MHCIRLTEEDLMWQLEGMDQDELIAMGLVPDPEQEQPQEQSSRPPAPAPEASDEPRISDEERIELFTVNLQWYIFGPLEAEKATV